MWSSIVAYISDVVFHSNNSIFEHLELKAIILLKNIID